MTNWTLAAWVLPTGASQSGDAIIYSVGTGMCPSAMTAGRITPWSA